ncbi:N-terminal double-transmembrane domain-containing protein [Microbulbifer donghaiensis]|uniref:N-terminal double-transmembrane domain-containing protein n=1 Tax=Microbulbifer donghaiensis TaxID=494016 RepID=A0A1M5B2W0_9GAMM|nr:BatA domain-containing protein [Microbulbifer donghaiensis]SHF36833.1 N-terminal double-transmembrane domain-containing protein [Microbulbifer donghaiensis]
MQWLPASLQSPLWLWLLGALAIPLLIHLLRRSNPREITFAAAHWLRQKPQQNWKRLFLRDKLLLLLRLLLIALLALLLAQPLLNRDAQPEKSILLVDPRMERAELREFLDRNFSGDETFTEIFWLQARPSPIAEQRPPAPDLWQTLSALADQAAFRRAHILLRSDNNPSGRGLFKFSPHWQWHAVQQSGSGDDPNAPRIALLGDGPAWLEPVMRQWRNTAQPQLALQQLTTTAAADAESLDWLIYDTPGPLPESLHDFIRDGGLLITDQRVQPAAAVDFVALETEPGEILQAAAIGRGSWLRYRHDWHGEQFFRRADLPRRLWQQWSAQDWALQSRSRANWSIDAPPGIAVPDTDVPPAARATIERPLLVALLLLLALERLLALSGAMRFDARKIGEQRD